MSMRQLLIPLFGCTPADRVLEMRRTPQHPPAHMGGGCASGWMQIVDAPTLRGRFDEYRLTAEIQLIDVTTIAKLNRIPAKIKAD